jgi:uncharacterized protein YdiU (UPF0061 family)
MDYKAELERLKVYLQTEIDFINDDDALEDRYARQANKSALEKVNQILKREETEATDENSGLHLQRVMPMLLSIAKCFDDYLEDLDPKDDTEELSEAIEMMRNIVDDNGMFIRN